MPFPLVAAVLLLVVASLAGATAAAQAAARRVAVFAGAGRRDGAMRIAAELAALGLEVEVLTEDEAPGPAPDMGAAARGAGASAAVRLGSGGSVEAWASDARGGVVYRQQAPAGEGEATEDELALGAVELLRACLVEIDVTPREPEAEIRQQTPEPPALPPAEPPPVAPEPGPPRLSVGVAPAVSAVAFTASPTVNVLVDAHVRVAGTFGVEVLGITPMVPAVLDEDEGRAEIHFGLAGGGARLGFGPLVGRWHPRIALGFAAALLRLSARAEEPYAGREELVAAPLPYVRLGLGLAVHERVLIRAEALAGWTLRRTTVEMAGREVANLGAPLLAGALGVELNVF